MLQQTLMALKMPQSTCTEVLPILKVRVHQDGSQLNLMDLIDLTREIWLEAVFKEVPHVN